MKMEMAQVREKTNSYIAAVVYKEIAAKVKKNKGEYTVIRTTELLKDIRYNAENYRLSQVNRGIKILLEAGLIERKVMADFNKIELIHKVTGERKEYKNMTVASKALGRNPSYIQNFRKRGKNETPEYIIKNIGEKARGKVTYAYRLKK
jgi:uncharacterized Fe-S center protein